MTLHIVEIGRAATDVSNRRGVKQASGHSGVLRLPKAGGPYLLHFGLDFIWFEDAEIEPEAWIDAMERDRSKTNPSPIGKAGSRRSAVEFDQAGTNEVERMKQGGAALDSA